MQPDQDPSNSDKDIEFKARKEGLHDRAHSGEGHGTEMGWLVSYADMMTLLFGLFVILFSLRTDKTKDMEGIMKEASDKYFRAASVDKPVESPVDTPKEMPPTPKTDDKPKEDVIQNMQALLKQESEKHSQQLQEVEARIEKIIQEKKELQAKIEILQRKPSSNPTSPKPENTESLKTELEQIKKQNEVLNEELAKEKNKNPTQSYMMVLLSWDTEKHDLDLRITAPGNKMYDFKKRKIKGEPGSFELDSRYGPGLEMWRAENFKPGRYTCKVTLYNKNGNEANPKIQISVVTNLQNSKSSVLELDQKKKQMDVVFEVDKEGAVQFLN